MQTPRRRAGAALERRRDVEPGVGPLSVNHTGQLPSVTLSFNLRRASRSATRVARVQDAGARDAAGDRSSAASRARRRRSRTRCAGLGVILLLAIFVIYVVLGILYESFIHPLTILSGLPSAGFGALLTLLLFKQSI